MTELAGVEGVEPLVDPGVVKALEDALELAKAGDLGAVAIAMVHRDYGMQAGFCFGRAPAALLFGSIDRLRHKLHQDLDE